MASQMLKDAWDDRGREDFDTFRDIVSKNIRVTDSGLILSLAEVSKKAVY